MKTRLIQDIRELLQEKAAVSEKAYIDIRDKLKEKYKTQWVSSYMTDEECGECERLQEDYKRWKNALDEFENNEFY